MHKKIAPRMAAVERRPEVSAAGPQIDRVLPHRLESMGKSKTDNYNAAALESLRQINRELLVTSMSDVAEKAANECDYARDHITKAIRLLVPISDGVTRSVEELPTAIFKALVRQSARKFACLLPPGFLMESEGK